MAMNDVVDEMVEKVAKAIYDVRREWLCLDDRWAEHDDLMKGNYYDMARAALAAQGQEPVAIKELEWRRGYGDRHVTISQANALGGLYQVRVLEGVVWLDNIGFQTVYPSVEAAKAAAQADFETRIRSALTAPAQPVDVPDGKLSLGWMPSYGRCSANDMLKAVTEAIYGDRDYSILRDIDNDRPIGHQMVPKINFNSLNRIISAFAATQPPAEGGWRDMSTAPRDGTRVLVYVPDFKQVTEAWYCAETGLWPRDEAYTDEGEPCNVGLPSRWQPMPLPPAPANGGDQ